MISKANLVIYQKLVPKFTELEAAIANNFEKSTYPEIPIFNHSLFSKLILK